MHELAITEGLISGASPNGCRASGSRRVRLEIGALSGVVADCVRFCFDLVTEGTLLAGAELEISEPAPCAAAWTAASRFEPEDHRILLCPCGSANVRVVSGQELMITSVKVA